MAKTFRAEKFNGWSQAHRALLLKMSSAEIGKLLSDGASMEHVNYAAVCIADDDLEAALRIYDAFLAVPLDDLEVQVPVDATSWLISAREDKHSAFTKERARKYVARWAPFAKRVTLLYLNLATLYVALDQLPKAIAALREGILEGDPGLPKQIHDDDDDDLVLLSKQPGFKQLSKLKPLLPPALRSLELATVPAIARELADAIMKCDLELVFAHPTDDYFLADDPRVGNRKKGLARFQVFGALPDGGEVAFWKRKPDLAECPVVIFGSDGALSVYARDFDGFLSLLAHGCRMHDVENDGFRVDDDEEWEPPTARDLAKKLKPMKAIAAAVATWSPAAKKRKPEHERAAAMAMVPELIKEFASLSKR